MCASPVITVKIFVAVLLLSFAVFADDSWIFLKKSHVPRTLTTSRLRTLAEMSDRDRFKEELNPLLVERPSGSAANQRVQQFLISRMQTFGWHVEVDQFREAAPNRELIPFTNIVATLDPTARRRLVLACHFDSKNITGFIGATDSAVPCAMMLDLARSMDSILNRPRNEGKDLTLQFIFFDGEEAFRVWTPSDSIYGARHLASLMEDKAHPRGNADGTNELDGMDVMVLMDLLGTKDPRLYSYFDATQSLFERLNRIEKKLAQAGELSDHTSNGAEYFRLNRRWSHGFAEDDHIPFLRRDVRILHLITNPFPSVWHRLTDDEAALDYPTIDNLNKIMRAFVAEYLHLPV